MITPYIVQSLGWQWAFYLFGLLGGVWYLFWHRTVAAIPTDDPKIGAEELEIISAGATPKAAGEAVPWKALLTSMPVWAIIVAHFCNNWSLYVLLSWLPTFVNKGLGVDYAAVG